MAASNMCDDRKIALKLQLEVGNFTRTSNIKCLSDVAGTVKPERCMCSQGFRNKIARIFIEFNFLQHVVDTGDTWLHTQPPSTSVAEQR